MNPTVLLQSMDTVEVDTRGWLRRLLKPEPGSRPGWSEPTAPADTELIELLQQRDGLLTTVRLKDGSTHVVRDIAWGYDLGDEYAHITTNVRPGGEALPIDFFHSDAIVSLVDTGSGKTLRQ